MKRLGYVLSLLTILGVALGGCAYVPPGYYYYNGQYVYHPGGFYPVPYPYPY
jgi:hypothetical protein